MNSGLSSGFTGFSLVLDMARRPQAELDVEKQKLIQIRHQILDSWVLFEGDIADLYNCIVHPGAFSPYTIAIFRTIKSPEIKLQVLDAVVRAYADTLSGADELVRCWEQLYRKADKFRSLRNTLAHQKVATLNTSAQSYVRSVDGVLLPELAKMKIPFGYSVSDLDPLRLRYNYLKSHFWSLKWIILAQTEGRISPKELPLIFRALDKHLTEKWNQIFQYPPQ
ncbi:MAG: hypothetical protein HKP56_09075 [Anderseniella sp.]|nr:hypothetical protein [Anderseniella sp.]